MQTSLKLCCQGRFEMLEAIFKSKKPVIGVIHLLPLPGSARWTGDLEEVLLRAEQEALALASGGIDSIIIENFFDAPFAKDRVDVSTACALTLAVKRVSSVTSLPIGVNVLRNDALTALAIATVCGAAYVRVNVLSGAMVTDQGIIESDARNVLLYRRQLMGDKIKIFADVMVKHAYPLGEGNDIALAAKDTMLRAGGDALIVSGTGTGQTPDMKDLKKVRKAMPEAPIFVGSGSTQENVRELLSVADGIIVGTTLKRRGQLEQPVDVDRVRDFVNAVKSSR